MKLFSKEWFLKFVGISVSFAKSNPQDGVAFISDVSTVGNRDKLLDEDILKINDLIRRSKCGEHSAC